MFWKLKSPESLDFELQCGSAWSAKPAKALVDMCFQVVSVLDGMYWPSVSHPGRHTGRHRKVEAGAIDAMDAMDARLRVLQRKVVQVCAPASPASPASPRRPLEIQGGGIRRVRSLDRGVRWADLKRNQIGISWERFEHGKISWNQDRTSQLEKIRAAARFQVNLANLLDRFNSVRTLFVRFCRTLRACRNRAGTMRQHSPRTREPGRQFR